MVNDTALMIHDDTALTRVDPEHASAALGHILATGDLSQLTNEQRVAFYKSLCLSFGLNMFSRPFDWLVLDDRLVLYPNKSCSEQLRRQHQISIKVTRFDVIGSKTDDPMAVCTVEARRPNGVTDQATKYVSLTGWNSKSRQRYRLSGRELANAYAKAETGAKRRVTFSMVGLATPSDDLDGARRVVVDGTGRIIEHPSDAERALASDPSLAKALNEPMYEDADAPSVMPTTASQAQTLEELTPPSRPYSRTTFHCDKARWSRTWAVTVRGTFLEDADARHDFVGWYTQKWPENRRTSSLSTFLDHATDRQAEALVNSARETIADRASFVAAQPAEAEHEPPAAPPPPARPDAGVEYDLGAWRAFYDDWGAALARLDNAFTPWPDDVLAEMSLDELKRETLGMIGQVDSISIMLDHADDDERQGLAF